MRILIAEDSPIIQKLNSELMNSWGFDFDIASNGIETIEYARKNNGGYDLCLMDIEMPKMNGIEATQIIRKTTKYFPIMGLTSNSSYKQVCHDAGMDDFAEKPCKPDSLFNKISELTVKSIICLLKKSSLITKEEMPVDQKHAEELRELAKRGLCKMRLKGSGAHDVTVTVHKHVPYSISHDFVEEEAEVTTFLDRDSESPGEVFLYKSSCLVPVILLDEEAYAEKCQLEDDKMKERNTLVTEKKE
ncbi:MULTISPECIES: response regulator [unclassified Microbulbifer]|uniref:response regulator n=1 Tax=unclassified Microbulbifer TaxID=2619833 RepID=UPI0027E4CF27|nr:MULTISPECIES: response regulator [unclassified Microbulbifer]